LEDLTLNTWGFSGISWDSNGISPKTVDFMPIEGFNHPTFGAVQLKSMEFFSNKTGDDNHLCRGEKKTWLIFPFYGDSGMVINPFL